MKKLILAAAVLAAAGAGAYAIASKGNPAQDLMQALTQTVGPDGTIALDGCTLRIDIEKASPGGAVALTRVAIQADLGIYNTRSANILPGTDLTRITFHRGAVRNRMVDQAKAVIAAGGDRTQALVADGTALRKTLGTQGSALSFSVMAEVKSADDGSKSLTAHADAPDFHSFATAVQSLPAPVSYRVTTSYASAPPTADTFLTGQVAVIPPLVLTTQTEDQAKALARAIMKYSSAEGCN